MLAIVRGVLIALGAVSAAACVNRMAVDTTAGIMAEAESSTRAYFDWESAGYAAPSGLMQLEGLHVVSPTNDELALTLAKAYMAYAYGWVMDEYELAEARGDYDQAKHQQQRAYLMYTRAHDLVLSVAARRDPELPAVLTKDTTALAAHLKEHWRDKEDDLPVLFWLMMTWSSSVNNALETDTFIDMPMIRALAAHLAELDAGYEDAGALVFLGGFECSMPAAVGGDPKKGKEYFERALKLTQRKNHIVLFNYAHFCAVALQDRALYNAILHEILEAPDQGNPYRLSNKVARRRAQRALAKIEELFE